MFGRLSCDVIDMVVPGQRFDIYPEQLKKNVRQGTDKRQDNERSRTQALQGLQVRISKVDTQINNIHFIQLETLIDLQSNLTGWLDQNLSKRFWNTSTESTFTT